MFTTRKCETGADAGKWYTVVIERQGRLDEAIASLERLRALSPGYPAVSGALAHIQGLLGPRGAPRPLGYRLRLRPSPVPGRWMPQPESFVRIVLRWTPSRRAARLTFQPAPSSTRRMY